MSEVKSYQGVEVEFWEKSFRPISPILIHSLCTLSTGKKLSKEDKLKITRAMSEIINKSIEHGKYIKVNEIKGVLCLK